MFELRGKAILVLLTVAACLPFTAMACDDDDDEDGFIGDETPTETNGDAETPDGEVTAEEILDEPEAYYGASVTVTDEIVQLRSDDAFTIGELGGEVLVLQPLDEPDEWDYAEGDQVRVSGTVMELVTANDEDFGDDFGWIFEDDEIFSEFEGNAVIRTDEITLVEED